MSRGFLKYVGRWKSQKDVGRRNYRNDFFKSTQTQSYYTARRIVFSLFLKRLRKVLGRTSVGGNLRRTSVGGNLGTITIN